MDKAQAKHKVREGEKQKNKNIKQESRGHKRGMLMEGADTKKETDLRVAVEEEVRI